MRSFRPVFVGIFFAASLLLSGCQSQESIPPTLTPIVLTATAENTVTPNSTQTATVTATATGVPSQTPTQLQQTDTPVAPADIECGEPFCQVAWQGYLERPFDSSYRRTIDLSYPYASTMNGMFDLHHGVEFPNGYGSPVLAAAPGEVVYAASDSNIILGPFPGFYGNVIILQHTGLYQGEDLFTLYAHLSEMDVAVGDQVNQGQKIGEVGATGAADGPHLHFEVRLGDNHYHQTTNPILWFAPLSNDGAQQSAALAGLLLDRYGQPLSEFDVVLEKMSDDGVVEERYYTKTYKQGRINSHPLLGENFVIPDIPPGTYRFVFIIGTMHQFTFRLEPGSLGLITFQAE